jgi:hypothetical protein
MGLAYAREPQIARSGHRVVTETFDGRHEQLRLPEDECGYTVCGIGLHRRRYVAVEVECDRDVRVTKPFLDDLRMYAGLEGEGRPGMAQVVQTYRGQPEFGGAVPEVARRRIGMKRRPILVREYEAQVGIGGPDE